MHNQPNQLKKKKRSHANDSNLGDADLKPWFWQFYILLSTTGLENLITSPL